MLGLSCKRRPGLKLIKLMKLNLLKKDTSIVDIEPTQDDKSIEASLSTIEQKQFPLRKELEYEYLDYSTQLKTCVIVNKDNFMPIFEISKDFILKLVEIALKNDVISTTDITNLSIFDKKNPK